MSQTQPRWHAGQRWQAVASPIARLFGTVAAVAGLAGCALFAADRPDTSSDGIGHRIVLESPATMLSGVCPEYRENPGRTYYWDSLAFRTPIEAELEYCQKIDTGPLGRWVVEERFDEHGQYSISAHVEAVAHSVVHDWGDIAPKLWVSCWHREEDPAGSSLDVWLWHFGPPQRSYGERTPVRYQFGGQGPSSVALWWGHPGQAEVALLVPPDSHRLARDMRRVAEEHENEDSGPMLQVETWEGASLSGRGTSQGRIDFDLVGLERAAFPVLDACEARDEAS